MYGYITYGTPTLNTAPHTQQYYTAASGGAVTAVAKSPDAIAVSTDAGDQFVKPGRRGQFCNNVARPGGRRGLPARPARRRDKTGIGGRRRCRRNCTTHDAVAPRAHDAVAMSLDAGQKLVLSSAARDHIATTERPRKVIVAARALLWTPTRRPRSQADLEIGLLFW